MELQLKHITPYPEDLKIFDGTGYYNYKGFSYSNKKIFLSKENEFPKNKALSKCKLVLRPLSDLTKEISINNGKKFVPMRELFSCDIKEEETFDIYGVIPDYWNSCLNVMIPEDWEYKDIVMLFKWHFDVFKLIPEGLAIDKNILE